MAIRLESLEKQAAALAFEHAAYDRREGSITDEGYINQRAVLENRAALVEQLHAGGAGVVSV